MEQAKRILGLLQSQKQNSLMGTWPGNCLLNFTYAFTMKKFSVYILSLAIKSPVPPK